MDQEKIDQEKKGLKLPKVKLKLPFKSKGKKYWLRVGLMVLGVLALAYFVCLVVAGIGIYKYRLENKFIKTVEKIFPYPAAIVGSNLITMYDLSKEVGYIKYFYEKTAPDQAPETALIEKQVIDRLIQEKVIEKLSRENGVSISSKEVDDQFNKIADENGGQDKVKQILFDLYGLDVNAFKHLIKAQLLQEKLMLTKQIKDLQINQKQYKTINTSLALKSSQPKNQQKIKRAYSQIYEKIQHA